MMKSKQNIFSKFFNAEIKPFFPFGQTHPKPAPISIKDENLFYMVVSIPGYKWYDEKLNHEKIIMKNILKEDVTQILKENKKIKISSPLYKSGKEGLTLKEIFADNRVSQVGFHMVLTVKAPSITAQQCEKEKPYQANSAVATETISKLKMSDIVSVNFRKSDKEIYSINNSKFQNNYEVKEENLTDSAGTDLGLGSFVIFN